MEATERFADVVLRDPVPLDEAAFLIGAHGDPTCDVQAGRDALDRLASDVGTGDLESLLVVVFGELGFSGDRDDYYDPRNSYLHEVIRRRLGIPITLSVLLMEIGRRSAVPLVGISTPAHFITRVADDDRYVDAFAGGLVMDRDELETRFATLAPGIDLDPYLEPAGSCDILRRILANLIGIHRSRSDRDGLLWAAQLRTLLPGATADDHRIFGGALAAAGDFARAAKVLESLVDDGQADDPDRALHEAHRLRARLN